MPVRDIDHHFQLERASAQNLHRNPQILSTLRKRTANRPGMVRPWRRSSAFDFGEPDCRGGCSAMPGG
jgi:hypothetical protein